MAKKTFLQGKKGQAILYYFTVEEDTKEFTAYAPVRIDGDNSLLDLARINVYDIRNVRIGTSPIKHRSVMVPCDTAADGTRLSPQEQIRKAMQYTQYDILDQQKEYRNTRCLIPAKKGLWKRCPYSDSASTNEKHRCCDGTGVGDACPYSNFKKASTMVPFSELDTENDSGEHEPYEIASPISPDESTRYEELSADFLKYLQSQKPRLIKLAELLVKGYTQSEAEQVLGKTHSTIWSQNQLLKQYTEEFLRTVVIS